MAHDMSIEISAFAWVPEAGQGWVKDLRVRWALKEAGLPYTVRHLAGDAPNRPDYRAWHPFGQVPAYRDREVQLFESGAILLRVSELSDSLRPWDAQDRANTTAWLFGALNTMEPRVENYVLTPIMRPDADWLEGYLSTALSLLVSRLDSLAAYLDGRDWLCARFGVADVVMGSVLRGLQGGPLLADRPALAAYLDRCLSRPAFAAALDEQIEDFRRHAAA